MAQFKSAFYTLEGDKLKPTAEAGKMKNADHDSVMQDLSKYVEDKIEYDFQFSKIAIPPMATEGTAPSADILVSQDWTEKEKLLIFVQNQSGGYIGIWSRSLCFDQGLARGTMIPYISKALKNDFGVMILRPNTNSIINSKTGKKEPIVGSETPEIHALCVWENVIPMANNVKSINFISYGNGATLCHDLFLKSTLDHRYDMVTGIACIEASAFGEKDDPTDIKNKLQSIAVNFECSKPCPRGSHMQFRDERLGCSSLSMGLPDGDTDVVNVAVSAYMALDPVFDFLNLVGKAAKELRNGGDGSLISRRTVPTFRTKFAKKCKLINDENPNPLSAVITVNPDGGNDLDSPVKAPSAAPTTPGGTAKPGFFSSLFGSSKGADGGNAMPSKPTKPKELSTDDFDMLKIVGKGAFGKVLLVKKLSGDAAGQLLAMKVLKKSAVIDQGQVDHTNAEQAILKQIKHPFVVGLRFSFQSTDKLYLVTDYYSGGNLFAHLRESRAFSEVRAKFYAAELMLALEHLHSKDIVYRDLKLENILMDSKGHIILTDFGLSKPDIDKSGGASTFCGTAEYIAPEILQGQNYSMNVDWWSFGILLYEMMNGRTPFYNKNKKLMYYNITHKPPDFDAKIYGPEAQEVIRGLLTLDANSRLGSKGMKQIHDTAFFRTIDIAKLEKKAISPPFVPEGGENSTNYVSKSLAKVNINRDTAVMPGPKSTPEMQKKMDSVFKGFAYSEENDGK